MKIYKQKIFPRLILCLTIILSMFIALINSWNGGKTSVEFARAYTVLAICFSFIVIFVAIKEQKMNRIQINDNLFVLHKPKGLLSDETTIIWKDIRVIRCYGKMKLTQELNICTRYKNIIFRIANYKDYKEMLTIVLEKTASNENIRIDEAVYNILN